MKNQKNLPIRKAEKYFFEHIAGKNIPKEKSTKELYFILQSAQKNLVEEVRENLQNLKKSRRTDYLDALIAKLRKKQNGVDQKSVSLFEDLLDKNNLKFDDILSEDLDRVSVVEEPGGMGDYSAGTRWTAERVLAYRLLNMDLPKVRGVNQFEFTHYQTLAKHWMPTPWPCQHCGMMAR